MAGNQQNTGSAHPPAPSHFSPEGLRFLRQLARNNQREWFQARRAVFEGEVRQPMLAIIAAVTDAMTEFAPAHVRPPEKSLMRIYRDIRFSTDKRPYKSHIAAWWTRDGLPKTSGAGYYLHISGKDVHIAAGIYMPPREQLRRVREFLLEHHGEVRRALRRPALQRLFQVEAGAPLSRVPKGFPKDHAADDLLRQQQWGVYTVLPHDAAIATDFAQNVIRHFRAASPLIELLNTPLAPSARASRKPLFGLP